MSSPKVSVIVPVYNVEKYLKRCVDSLVGQSLQDIEIVLVDDCSPDSSPSLCDELAKSDKRIRVVHKPVNEGLGMARNTGIDNASGDYIMFLDSDDTYHPDACKRLYNACVENDAQISSGCFHKETSPNDWIEEHELTPGLIKGHDIRSYVLDMIACPPSEYLERKHPVSVCLLCIKRSLVVDNNVKFLSERVVCSEDTLFKIAILNCCTKLMALDYPFYNYYINGASLTHTFRIKFFDQLPELKTRLLSLFDKDDKEAAVRIYRFITSDARAHILRLLSSTTPSRYSTLRYMLNSDIWTRPSYFPMKELPLSKRIYMSLCQRKITPFVYLYSLLLNNR